MPFHETQRFVVWRHSLECMMCVVCVVCKGVSLELVTIHVE